MATIGYVRVSSVEQNLDLQMDALQRAGCEKIFQDKESGAMDNRPGLLSALDILKPGDCLVVWKLDRLGRSVQHLITTVTALRMKGIEFKSLTETIDTTTPGGKLVFVLFAALAEFERDLIRTRTKAGLEAARARGRVGGRPSKMDVDKILMAEKLMADQQHSVSAISRGLGVSRSTLYRSLNLQGKSCFNKITPSI